MEKLKKKTKNTPVVTWDGLVIAYDPGASGALAALLNSELVGWRHINKWPDYGTCDAHAAALASLADDAPFWFVMEDQALGAYPLAAQVLERRRTRWEVGAAMLGEQCQRLSRLNPSIWGARCALNDLALDLPRRQINGRDRLDRKAAAREWALREVGGTPSGHVAPDIYDAICIGEIAARMFRSGVKFNGRKFEAA
jgi:hypothetical protein